MAQIKIEAIQTLPARNFCAGEPRNPATYVAYADDGQYYEGFVSEYADKSAFEADASDFFNCVGFWSRRAA